MPSSKPAPEGRRRTPSTAVVLAGIVLAALIGVVLVRVADPASQPQASVLRSRTTSAMAFRPPPASSSPDPTGTPPGTATAGRTDDDAIGLEDGLVPDGVTVFRDDVPGVAKLDPALLGALRAAATDAAADGVPFTIHSAWRSRAYQEELLHDAVVKYASEEEAARWVAPPDKSAHVSGDAIDLEDSAASWLAEHGAAYGLCAIYDNEDWHYELRPRAVDHGCPDRYADAAHDPRMQP